MSEGGEEVCVCVRGKKPCLVVTRVRGKLIAHFQDELRIATFSVC